MLFKSTHKPYVGWSDPGQDMNEWQKEGAMLHANAGHEHIILCYLSGARQRLDHAFLQLDVLYNLV